MSLREAVPEFFEVLGRSDYTGAGRIASRVLKSQPFVSNLLCRLASCESVYTSMAFLKPSIFRKEDFLTNGYASILEDINKESSIRWTSCGGPPPPPSREYYLPSPDGSLDNVSAGADGDVFFVIDFALRLRVLIKVRRALIAVYKQLATLGGQQQQQQQIFGGTTGGVLSAGLDDTDDIGGNIERHTILQDVLDEISGIRTLATSDSNLACSFRAYGRGILMELSILRDLIQADMAVDNYCFKDAVVLLFRTRQVLTDWTGAICAAANRCRFTARPPIVLT